MSKENKILHLTLKHIWWNLIETGKKTSEYRRYSNTWNSNFGLEQLLKHHTAKELFERNRFWSIPRKPYNIVVLHKGYTSRVLIHKIDDIRLLIGMPNDLNEDPCWEIVLGERLK